MTFLPREAHRGWQGDRATPHQGRKRAIHWYPIPPGQVCCECEVRPAVERHHWDENTLNNDVTNIEFVCHRCHARLHKPIERVPREQRRQTHCKRGHLYDEANTYVTADGARHCRACRREYMREYRRR